jgi:hypothetical protein
MCGGDERTCACTAPGGLLEFLSDFRGRQSHPAGRALPAADTTADPLTPNSRPGLGVAPSSPVPSAPFSAARKLPPPDAGSHPPGPPPSTPGPLSPPVSRQNTEPREWMAALRSLDWVENPLATTSMFLGLASIYLPVLAVPSVTMAVICLRRLRVEPWRKGKARAIAGIVASAVLAPISLAVWLTIL